VFATKILTNDKNGELMEKYWRTGTLNQELIFSIQMVVKEYSNVMCEWIEESMGSGSK